MSYNRQWLLVALGAVFLWILGCGADDGAGSSDPGVRSSRVVGSWIFDEGLSRERTERVLKAHLRPGWSRQRAEDHMEGGRSALRQLILGNLVKLEVLPEEEWKSWEGNGSEMRGTWSLDGSDLRLDPFEKVYTFVYDDRVDKIIVQYEGIEAVMIRKK